MDEKRIYRAALKLWGADAQTLMAFEEMAELQKELCKHARGKDNREAIAEEIADVEIMLGQMKILHVCTEAAAEYRESKLRRLAIRCGLDMDGEPEPVKLGPGVTFHMENTSVSGPRNLSDGAEMTLEDLIRKTVEETFKAWTATAKDGGCIVIPEAEAAEIERAIQEAGPGTIVAAEPDTPGVWELMRDILAGRRPAPEGTVFDVVIDMTGNPQAIKRREETEPAPRVLTLIMPGGENVKLNSPAEAFKLANRIKEMAHYVWTETANKHAPGGPGAGK